MKLNILLYTCDYRGDHAADVAVAYEYKEGETIEELVARTQVGKNVYAAHGAEHLEIRLIAESETKP